MRQSTVFVRSSANSSISVVFVIVLFFFFNDTATTEIYTLSLHDALPILLQHQLGFVAEGRFVGRVPHARQHRLGDRKSTRLNSSHRCISYAVFCLKKKKNKPLHILF